MQVEPFSGLEKLKPTRIALVAWDHICTPTAASSGWNVVDLRIGNGASLCKLIWNLAQKQIRLG